MGIAADGQVAVRVRLFVQGWADVTLLARM